MRSIAIDILDKVLYKNAYTNIALRQALANTSSEPRDRAFITDLVQTTMRNLLLIDEIIKYFAKTINVEPTVYNIIRLAVCQIRFMDKVPSHAAVDEAVKLTKVRGFGYVSKYVNWLLREICREPNKPKTDNPYSYPKWLFDCINTWLGSDAEKFFINSHKPPSVTIFTNTLKCTPVELESILKKAGIETVSLQDGFFAISNTGDITKLSAFKNGMFFVMDPAAVLAVKALDLQPGCRLIDMTAAPGGKSFAASVLMNDNINIYSFDCHEHKVGLIKQGAKRLGITSIIAEVRDSTVIDESLINSADCVLVDAPCSGLGTLRKHPEIKYRKTEKDIIEIAKLQYNLLSAAEKYVRPGGILVYSTCTVSKTENKDVVHAFLENHSKMCEVYSVQTLPDIYQDGFFVSQMIKK